MSDPQILLRLKPYLEQALKAETLEVARMEAGLALRLLEKNLPQPKGGKRT
jgi:hypothetical protein